MLLDKAINHIALLTEKKPMANWYMPGDPRYQPKELRPYLGYDQWARWLIIVEWFWMLTLVKLKEIPEKDAKFLTQDRLFRLLNRIPTTLQDSIEAITKHDIIALLKLMRRHLPRCLHRYLHLGATSYDIINTAYALQLEQVFKKVVWPELQTLDKLWRQKIKEYVDVVQAGRTHLQTALPVTVGFWLSGLHSRFMDTAYKAKGLVSEIPGKFTGAVGTSSAKQVLFEDSPRHVELVFMEILGLSQTKMSTQITPPEANARFYFELVLLSGALANLGEDVRILQSSQFGELTSAASTSSTMSHKKGNPIAAENVAGMHTSVQAEFLKIMGTLVSDLQRDLRWSNVMRSFTAVIVYTFQQIKTAERIFKSLKVDTEQCRQNFEVSAKLVVAELLHLSLQQLGYSNAHTFVNKTIIPRAVQSNNDLVSEMDNYLSSDGKEDTRLQKSWRAVPDETKHLLQHPEQYLGNAVQLAEEETMNILS